MAARAISGNEYFRALAADRVVNEDAIYYFIQNEGGWKIQSRNTGKYFPVPTRSITFAPVDEASAGLWSLNFQANNNIAPSCGGYSLNRSQVKSMGTSVLHGWSAGTAQANQLQIYEIALSATSIVETNQEVSVSGAGETTLTTDQWYVLRSGSNFFVDDASSNFTTTTAPKGFGIHNSQYLVRLVSAGEGTYYVQTGHGNYLFGSNANIPTAVSATAYTADQLKAKWEFHKLVDPLQPTATEVYTLNGTGAWIFVPTGFDNQYYLYNIGEKKFAYPAESGAWGYSEEAVPVILESQGDSHYCIKTKDGAKTFVIGTEEHMAIAKLRDVTTDETTQLNTALNNLICWDTTKATKVTNLSEITDGWYALRVHSDSNYPDYAGNFIYTLPSENWAFGRPHPMSHGGEYMKHPLKSDAAYYVRLWPVPRDDGKTYYHWQVPNGKYVVNHNNDYPITWIRDASDFIIAKNDDGTFYIQSSGYRAQICKDDNGEDFLGRTARKYMASATHLDIYKLATDLVAWKVVFNTGADDVKLLCTNSNVQGLTEAYNHGYFFFPSDVTPNGATDFKIDNQLVTATVYDGAEQNGENKYTIHVTYAPDVCFTADSVKVVQGSRTTGVGNEQQAVLRVEVSPGAPCYPTSIGINLEGASNVQNVKAYLTSADQLHAEGVVSVPLGSVSNPSEGTVTIPVTYPATFSEWPSDHLLMMGEHNYIWITADIKNDATVESHEVDASINSISYANALNNTNTCTGFSGDPDGKMRIFYHQQYLWVSTDKNSDVSRFYRNPAVLNVGNGKVLAFSEYRHEDASELGKDYDESGYGHRIDIVMHKSTDNGLTWSATADTIAKGFNATVSDKAFGYSKPAAVLTKNGKVICLMAMGSEAYDSNVGIRHIGMMTSDDQGEHWSEITDIYDNIDWGTHSPSSAYVTSGRGVLFENGRVAFVLNERRSTVTDEYVIYSDDEGAHWTFAPSEAVFANGKESKLLVMNDNRLLATVSRGTDTNILGRGYNTTAGDATAEGISTWNTSSNWDSYLTSYGCNNDILYYGRAPKEAGYRDAVLHTVIQGYSGESGERFRDLRLYTSFDQTISWKELFTITPANAATSSIDKLTNENLVIFFEDGSIGNDEHEGCYALNCVVISRDQIEAQMTDLYTTKVIAIGASGSAPYVTWPKASGWTQYFTTNSETGYEGVVVSSTNDEAFNRESFDRENMSNKRVIDLKPSTSGTDIITITAPEGYVIRSYSITGVNNTSGQTTTLNPSNGGSAVTFGYDTSSTLSANDINYKTATFTASGTGGYLNITEFTVVLAKEYAVNLNEVNGQSYATLYVPFDLSQTDDKTKAYYITEVTAGGQAILTETADNGRKIPHNTAVVLINSDGASSTSFAVAKELGTVVTESENLLKGTLTGIDNLDLSTEGTFYSLGVRGLTADIDTENEAWVVGFYQTGGTITLAANRAYLDTTIPSPVYAAAMRGFDLSFDADDPATSIANDLQVNPRQKGDSPYYTLDGRQLVGRPTVKGIYLKNGKKILIH